MTGESRPLSTFCLVIPIVFRLVASRAPPPTRSADRAAAVEVLEQIALVRLIPADAAGRDRAEIQAVDQGRSQQPLLQRIVTRDRRDDERRPERFAASLRPALRPPMRTGTGTRGSPADARESLTCTIGRQQIGAALPRREARRAAQFRRHFRRARLRVQVAIDHPRRCARATAGSTNGATSRVLVVGRARRHLRERVGERFGDFLRLALASLLDEATQTLDALTHERPPLSSNRRDDHVEMLLVVLDRDPARESPC